MVALLFRAILLFVKKSTILWWVAIFVHFCGDLLGPLEVVVWDLPGFRGLSGDLPQSVVPWELVGILGPDYFAFVHRSVTMRRSPERVAFGVVRREVGYVQINISTRHGHLSQETQEKINDKVSRLPRLLERLTVANVTIDMEHQDAPQVEIRISVEHGRDVLANETSTSVMAALDGTIHKVEQQLRKHKQKLKDHKAAGLKHQPAYDETEDDVD